MLGKCARAAVIIGMAAILNGCASGNWVSIFRTTELDKGATLVTDAKQRVITNLPANISNGRNNPSRIVCAEPSPDALVAIAQATAAEAQVAGKGGGGFSFAMSEAAASIGIRTATIQLLRDGLYRACEAYANGTIDKFGYALILNKIDDVMMALVGIEGMARIPPAAQVAIGGEATGKFEGKQSAEKAGEEKKSDSEGKGESQAKAITAAFNTLTIDKHDAQAMEAVAAAITKLAQKDRPGSAVGGACLMWMSTESNWDPTTNKQQEAMLGFCAGAFATAKQAADAEIAARLSPAAYCMILLGSTGAAKPDKDTADRCEKIVKFSIQTQAKAQTDAKKQLDTLASCLKEKIKGDKPDVATAMKECQPNST